MGKAMNIAGFFRSKGFTSVAGRTYPGTFAIVRREGFLAAEPVWLSSQKLYVAVASDYFVKYDAQGNFEGRGALPQLV